jgi:hypothetical protein
MHEAGHQGTAAGSDEGRVMGRSIADRLADSAWMALSVEHAEWPRARAKAFAGAPGAPIPEGWTALVESADGRRRLAPAGDDPRVAPGERLALARRDPISVPLQFAGMPASCGKPVEARCDVVVRFGDSADELAALRRTLLASGELTHQELTRRLDEAGGAAALREFVRAHTAHELVHDDRRPALLALLREKLRAFLFDAGTRLEGVTGLVCNSPTLAREEALRQEAEQRVQQIQAREMVEQAARTAVSRRLNELAALLEKLRAVASTDPSLRWGELLPALSPGERGHLLENLWRITPDRARASAIVALTAAECVWLDPARPDQMLRRVRLPGDLGGLRSVGHDAQRRWLLVGAASGLWALRDADGEVIARYRVPAVHPPRTGFNAAAIVGERVYATHSQLGIWSWSLDGQAQSPQAITQTRDGIPKTVRAVTAMPGGQVAYAVDARVQIYDAARGEATTVVAADAAVHSIARDGANVYVTDESGKLLRVSLSEPQDAWMPYRRIGPLESVQVRRWNDLVELVVPAGPQGILAVYERESVTSRLAETSAPVRKVWACDDLVVGLTDTRDRLVVLNAHTFDRTAIDVPVARMAGSAVQDACIVAGSPPASSSDDAPAASLS